MKAIITSVLSALTLGLVGLRAEEKPAQPSTDNYPLTTCVVSGEELGSMGKPYVYVHKEQGQRDRAVQFCCRMCTGKFKKDPAQYLAKLDAAEAAAKAKKD